MTVTKKIILYLFCTVLLVSSVSAARTFYDDFDRGDSATVGGDWTESGSNGWTIDAKSAYATGSGGMDALNVSHAIMAYELNTSDVDTLTLSYQVADTKTLHLRFSTDTQLTYYDGGGYASCGAGKTFVTQEWIVVNGTSPYHVFAGTNTSNLTELCQITTTYDRGGADYKIEMISDNVGKRVDTVCGADDFSDCFALPSVGPTITVNNPTNGSHINTLETMLNITVTDPDSNTTVTIQTNQSGTWTTVNYTENVSNAGDVLYNMTGLSEGEYYWNASATDGVDTTDLEIQSFVVDVTSPDIDAGELENNNTIVRDTLTYSVNYTDAVKLFSANISVDGDLVNSSDNINATSFNFNHTLDATNLTMGWHNFTTTACDAHTAKKLSKNWVVGVSPMTSALSFIEGNNNIVITPSRPIDFSSSGSHKSFDRYSFEFKRSKLFGNNRAYDDFYVESDSFIHIIGDDKYSGWLVTDGKWVDFETDQKFKVKITRVSDYKVKVRVFGRGDYVFKSVGELNCNTEDYIFMKYNTTEEYDGDALETSSNVFRLYINQSGGLITGKPANFTYNETIYPVTPSSDNDSINFSYSLNVPLVVGVTNDTYKFNWTYEVNGTEHSSTTTNHIVHKMIVTNCTSSYKLSNYAINYTVVDDVGGSAVTADMSGVFTVWNRTSSISRTYPLAYNDSSNPQICIYPNNHSFNADYEVSFVASNYNTQYITSLGTTLSNYTKQEEIRMVHQDNSTAITITVVDSRDDPIPNYQVEAYRYSLATNNYTLVSSLATDINGLVKFNLYVADDQYQFLVYNNLGVLVYSSTTMYLYDTAYTFRIADKIISSVSDSLVNLQRTHSWNKTNLSTSVTWNDLTGLIDSLCLNVLRANISNQTELIEVCSSADAGTLSYGITNISGTYISNVYVVATEDQTRYLISSESFENAHPSWDIFGNEIMVGIVLLLGTLVMIALSRAPELALVVLPVGILFFYIMGFIKIAAGGIVGLAIAAIIYLIKLRKEYQ